VFGDLWKPKVFCYNLNLKKPRRLVQGVSLILKRLLFSIIEFGEKIFFIEDKKFKIIIFVYD